MTCDFWAENGKRKLTAKTKAIDSVASRRPSLRMTGPCVSSSEKQATATAKDKSNSKDAAVAEMLFG